MSVSKEEFMRTLKGFRFCADVMAEEKFSVSPTAFSLPASAWIANTETNTKTAYPYKCEILNNKIKSADLPVVIGDPSSQKAAEVFGIAKVCQVTSGAIKLYAESLPDITLSGEYYIIGGQNKEVT